jgi:hypothetical protein
MRLPIRDLGRPGIAMSDNVDWRPSMPPPIDERRNGPLVQSVRRHFRAGEVKQLQRSGMPRTTSLACLAIPEVSSGRS